MKLGISAAAFYGRMETEDQAAFISANLPVDVCEVFLETRSEYSGDFGRLVRKNLGSLPCVSVHPKGTQFESDLFGRSRRQQQDAFAALAGVLDAGAALGASYYVLHGPNGVHKPVDIRRIHEICPRFALMQTMARVHGMQILWENVHWATLREAKDITAAREMFPSLGFVLDVKQAHLGGSDPFEILAAMGDKVRHVHLLDWDADGELCLPGEGVFDFPRLMAQLRDQGFDGNVILQPYEHLTRDMDRLLRSVEYLRGVIA